MESESGEIEADDVPETGSPEHSRGPRPASSRPIVTVVIPTRDRAHVLERALESLRAQTWETWECFVVDDASTDGTRRLVEVWADRDSRIRPLRFREHRGAMRARNEALRRARGRYVAFLDSDDEWLPGKLERQVQALEGSPETVAGVTCGVRLVGPEGRARDRWPDARGHIYRQVLTRNPVGSPSRVMVRRRVFDEVGLFDPSLPAGSDRDLWIRIARRYRWDHVPEILVRYHETPDAMSEDPEAVREGARRLWEKHGLAGEPGRVRGTFLFMVGHRLATRGRDPAAWRVLLRSWRQAPWRLDRLSLATASRVSPELYRRMVRPVQRLRDRLRGLIRRPVGTPERQD